MAEPDTIRAPSASSATDTRAPAPRVASAEQDAPKPKKTSGLVKTLSLFPASVLGGAYRFGILGAGFGAFANIGFLFGEGWGMGTIGAFVGGVGSMALVGAGVGVAIALAPALVTMAVEGIRNIIHARREKEPEQQVAQAKQGVALDKTPGQVRQARVAQAKQGVPFDKTPMQVEEERGNDLNTERRPPRGAASWTDYVQAAPEAQTKANVLPR